MPIVPRANGIAFAQQTEAVQVSTKARIPHDILLGLWKGNQQKSDFMSIVRSVSQYPVPAGMAGDMRGPVHLVHHLRNWRYHWRDICRDS